MSESKNFQQLLFTPGPLNTSEPVKRAMLRDFGSRESTFIDLVRTVRDDLLQIAGVNTAQGFEAVPIQGSGTFGIESVIGSVIPGDGKLLTIVNGAYGRRITQIAECLGIPTASIEFEETEIPDPTRIDALIGGDPTITHVAFVHCETTTGILNPIQPIAQIVARHQRTFIVDAMSSFGGIPLDLSETDIDFLVSSANKCLEGVPGFSFVIARRKLLEAARGKARSVSFDLAAQWDGLEKDGQFRFTPPTHALSAFRQAMDELREEGGVGARHQRYQSNSDALIAGMAHLGFSCLTPRQWRSPIITAFALPDHPNFHFEQFCQKLADRRFIIYPGKLSKGASFRIGSIGNITASEIRLLLDAIRKTLDEMSIDLTPVESGGMATVQ